MSDYDVSPFWQYIKAADYRVCDLCGVTQKKERVTRFTEEGGKVLDACTDRDFCQRAQKERKP